MNYPDDIAQLRVPPHSLEAEQALIGGLLVPGSDLDSIADLVSEGDFYSAAHRIIYACIAKLAAAGKPVDIATVADSMTAEEMEQIGGFIYLVEMARSTPSTANLKAYAAAVKERASLRELITTGFAIGEMGFSSEGRSASELVDQAQTAVMALGERTAEAVDLHIAKPLRALADEWQRRYDHEGLIGVSTGFKALDARTNGLMAGDLIVLAARPSMGKTCLAMNIAEHVAVEQGKAVLVFSMEMTTSQILDRLSASLGRIPFDLIRTGRVFGGAYDSKLMPAASRLKNSPLYIDDRAALSVQQMRTTARRLHKKVPLSLIVVDYLQLAKAKAESRVHEVTAISQGLKALAKDLHVPVIALSQLSRAVDGRTSKRPINSDLRDSGAIEQDADVIMFIYRDEVYDEDSPDKGIAEIICTKQRNGPTGTDRLATNLAMMRFDDLSHEYVARNVEPIRKKYGAGGLD